MGGKIGRRLAVIWAAAALSGLLAVCGSAQDGYPNQSVKFVVAFAAGGPTDAIARILSQRLTEKWGHAVVIENRGGAGGTLGATVASKLAPDGYGLFMGAVHHTIAPSIYPKLEYDLEKDFVPISLVAKVPQVIVVNPKRIDSPDFKSFLALIKRSPGRYNYASAGNGTSHHLAGELFKLQTKTFITHIPYRGAGPALQDLVAGQLDVMFDGLGSSAGHIRAGRIKPLAVAAPQRSPAFPDVPTTVELGLPGYQVSTWYGLWAPKGTPPDVVARMIKEIGLAFGTKEIKDMWSSLGSEIPSLTGPAFGDFVATEMERWALVAKAAGAKLD